MAATEDFVFINATVLDGSEDMKPMPGRAVVVEKGKIVAIAASDEALDPA